MVDWQWVLKLILVVQPDAPWKDTFPRTAQAIASASSAGPQVFQGDEAPEQLASLMVAISKFESNVNPEAKGDCDKKDDKGMCVVGSTPHSFGLGQLHESLHAWLGLTQETALVVELNAVGMVKVISASFKECNHRPVTERLNFYTNGKAGCVQPKNDEGGHRVRLGIAIYKANPPPAKKP